MTNYKDDNGVWRTVGGRRIFIRDGEDLATAMKKSGKFNSKSNKKSGFYNKLSKEEQKKYDDYLKKGYSKEDIENTLMYKNQEDRMRETEIKLASDEEIKDLQNKAKKIFNQERLEKYNENWQKQIEENNAKMEKDVTDLQNQINDFRNKSYQSNDALERHRYWKEAERLQNKYYERFRENERANAKIKKEEPNEKYINIEAYAGYKDKFNETWGNDGSSDKVVSAKMYTNDEFMEHLEDANWHSERKQLLEANLTNKELSYIKDRTKVSAWGVENLTGKEQVDSLIKEAKSNNQISSSLRQKAYQKYLKAHPNSKMSFEDFKNISK